MNLRKYFSGQKHQIAVLNKTFPISVQRSGVTGSIIPTVQLLLGEHGKGDGLCPSVGPKD
jgi:hypothetical protein